ncbi:transposase [Pedobacter sp. Leaf176]|uniref:REP-associated tyrosine transposase n=1 Tax=Pedobacter sp. Leaf176 TaxID=1736286 RepID=UPI000A7C14D4|nr:transposase [Pedobacter sp. Leaf176]
MDSDKLFEQKRYSIMAIGEVYFWTDTIKDWQNVFTSETYAKIVLSTLKNLKNRKLIVVYAFVLMPNHLHIIWKMAQMNAKEMPHASFNKFTSHKIFEDMKANAMGNLRNFEVHDQERKLRLWQRDPLATLIDSKEKIEQKIDYVHQNPLQEKWNLCDTPENYRFSSAKYYLTGTDEFGFLTDYREEF